MASNRAMKKTHPGRPTRRKGTYLHGTNKHIGKNQKIKPSSSDFSQFSTHPQLKPAKKAVVKALRGKGTSTQREAVKKGKKVTWATRSSSRADHYAMGQRKDMATGVRSGNAAKAGKNRISEKRAKNLGLQKNAKRSSKGTVHQVRKKNFSQNSTAHKKVVRKNRQNVRETRAIQKAQGMKKTAFLTKAGTQHEQGHITTKRVKSVARHTVERKPGGRIVRTQQYGSKRSARVANLQHHRQARKRRITVDAKNRRNAKTGVRTRYPSNPKPRVQSKPKSLQAIGYRKKPRATKR